MTDIVACKKTQIKNFTGEESYLRFKLHIAFSLSTMLDMIYCRSGKDNIKFKNHENKHHDITLEN